MTQRPKARLLSRYEKEKEDAFGFGGVWDGLGMDQYLLIPFLVGWTSIYQRFNHHGYSGMYGDTLW